MGWCTSIDGSLSMWWLVCWWSPFAEGLELKEAGYGCIQLRCPKKDSNIENENTKKGLLL